MGKTMRGLRTVSFSAFHKICSQGVKYNSIIIVLEFVTKNYAFSKGISFLQKVKYKVDKTGDGKEN